jgi:endonuclease/exonuclease/phosphatase family metal-dependent hydrolase
MSNLKFCQINAENLFLLFDNPLPPNYLKLEKKQWESLTTSVFENKPLQKVINLAKTLNEIDADIVMLNEVGGVESLKNFNQYFLESKYSPILVEGNSDRSIDVGFLIKKNLPFYFDLFSHKNKEIDLVYPQSADKKITYRFSRDCAELRLFKSDVNNPFLIILLTHLKSPLDPERIDAGGVLRRASELRACVDIYNELKKSYPQTPVMLCGDFNGTAGRLNTDVEFAYLYANTDLEDVLELAQVPHEERHTFIQVKSGLRSEGRQIDYCFLPETLKSKLMPSSASTYLYRDPFGSPLKKPDTLEQKAQLPSDHYPLIFTLENMIF